MHNIESRFVYRTIKYIVCRRVAGAVNGFMGFFSPVAAIASNGAG